MRKRINSRQKGKRGERAFRDVLREAGYKAERGQQRRGGSDSPDVICPDLPDIHFEVKCVQSGHGKTYDWVTQAGQDCKLGQARVVAHKANGMYWLATMPMFDFLEIVRCSDLPKVNHDPVYWTTKYYTHTDVTGIPVGGKGKIDLPVGKESIRFVK